MGKNLTDIVRRLAEEKTVEGIIRNMKICVNEGRENLEDLAQDIYVDLLGKSDSLIEGLEKRGDLNFYITKMVINNVHSQSSPYYVKYKKFKTEEIYDKYEEVNGGIRAE